MKNDEVLRSENPSYYRASNNLSLGTNTRISHGLIGLTGEVGELADCFKKHIFYGQHFDLENFKEELGDCLWFITLLCDAAGTTIEECQSENVAKLKKRYPDKYNDVDAMLRKDK